MQIVYIESPDIIKIEINLRIVFLFFSNKYMINYLIYKVKQNNKKNICNKYPPTYRLDASYDKILHPGKKELNVYKLNPTNRLPPIKQKIYKGTLHNYGGSYFNYYKRQF